MLNSLKKSARATFSIRNRRTRVNSILTTTLTRRIARGNPLQSPLPGPMKPGLPPLSRAPPSLVSRVPVVVSLVRLPLSRVLCRVSSVLWWVSLLLCRARPTLVTAALLGAPLISTLQNRDRKNLLCKKWFHLVSRLLIILTSRDGLSRYVA